MAITLNKREVNLAFNWTKTRVQDCLDNTQKEELIRFISERYNERFFDPIHTLRQASGNHRGFGFAIMSRCSLLVETIQCYREFLPGIDGDLFFKKIRCWLLHQAQTKDGWRVTRTGNFWDLGNSTINREEFSMRLEQCFNGYLKELSVEPNWQSPIWTAVGKKIWWLIRVS